MLLFAAKSILTDRYTIQMRTLRLAGVKELAQDPTGGGLGLEPRPSGPGTPPSPTGGDAYLFGLQIKCLAQMRIKLSTAQERIKISAPQETQSVQYWTYSRWLLKELETHTLFQP